MFLLCKLIEDNLHFLVETCGFLVALSFFPGGTLASSLAVYCLSSHEMLIFPDT